jgi:hypothetical protein
MILSLDTDWYLVDHEYFSLGEEPLKACMNKHNLYLAPGTRAEVLKPRDAAYNQAVKDFFQEYTVCKFCLTMLLNCESRESNPDVQLIFSMFSGARVHAWPLADRLRSYDAGFNSPRQEPQCPSCLSTTTSC